MAFEVRQGLVRLRDWWRRRWPRRPQRTPTLLQMEAVECGAAALGIILAHYDRWVPLERLRIECGVSRDGSKANNLLRAARSFGLIAKGFKREPESLRDLPAPMILHWNFNHFIVLEGFHKDRVFLNDPAMGPRVVSNDELDQSFTGVVMVFGRGPDFETGGARPTLLPALRRRLVGVAPALVLIILAGLALVIPGLVIPVFSKTFVDGVLMDSRIAWLTPLLLAMAVTVPVVATLTWLQQYYLLRLETKLALTGSTRFLWHVLRLPVEFFNQRYAGEISARVGINERVAQLLSRDLAVNVLGTVMIVFFGLVMFRYDPWLTLSGVVAVALNASALRFISRKRVDGNRRLTQEKGKLLGTSIGGLSSIETVKASGGESDLYARWAGYQAKVVNIRQDLERYTLLLDAVPPLLSALNSALILGVGSLRVMSGALSLGGLIAFQALMAAFIAPVSRLVGLGATLQIAQADMDRLDDVFRYPIDESIGREMDHDWEQDEVRLRGKLELRGLVVGYSRLDKPLITDFSLTLEPGMRVALVGGSGSGKSTVARLIAGLYTPWDGEILFDGRPIRSVPPIVLNNSMAVVDQSVFLFEGSVRDNLTLWDSTVPLPEVIAAARDASIHEDVAARPGGYDSVLAEGGTNWSGGQRQRLEIARALVRRPSLLILDEATSALDPTTEKQIDECLRRRGCTTLMVAHRLSTIRDADEIIVLEQGAVVERGSHRELMAASGVYSDLLAAE